MLLPLDLGSHPHHWLLFDRVVQQIVLQTEDGKDLDAALVEIDVKGLIHQLADEEALMEARCRADELEKENLDISNRLAKVKFPYWLGCREIGRAPVNGPLQPLTKFFSCTLYIPNHTYVDLLFLGFSSVEKST